MIRSGCCLVVLIGIAVSPGCTYTEEPRVAESKVPASLLHEHWGTQEREVAHIVRRQYYLREGDALEVIYHVRHRQTEVYKIKIQDVVRIRFPYEPRLDQTEPVGSDGRLYLDLVGPVQAFNQTVDELRADLQKRYGKYLKDPTLTVSLKESNVKIRELKDAITTSPRGQSRLVPITPDGTISLPFIVNIRAAGRTINDLHAALNEAYQEIGLEELEVTVNVQSVAPLRVFVFGEVFKPGTVVQTPGLVSAISELTLLQAIAQVGGYLPGRAELSQVTLMRRRHLPRPEIAVVNVYQLLENRKRAAGKPVVANSSKYRYDIWLEDGDLIYIPTSDMAKRADYIDLVWTRGIRAVTGFTTTAGYSAGDSVDWLGPNP